MLFCNVAGLSMSLSFVILDTHYCGFIRAVFVASFTIIYTNMNRWDNYHKPPHDRFRLNVKIQMRKFRWASGVSPKYQPSVLFDLGLFSVRIPTYSL